MSNPPLKIPADYVNPGLSTLDLEFPWIVPDSAHLLNEYVSATHTVLDLGSGGSTLFYARRCRHVHAVETIRDYYDIVRDKIEEKGLGHKIDYCYVPATELADYIASLPDQSFDIVGVDTMRGTSRSALFNAMLPKWCGSIIVMDNWAHKGLWPEHARLTVEQLTEKHALQDYDIHQFVDPGWKGLGTRLVIKKDLSHQQ
jgi:predicted O-methyltransferase YrrM